MSQPAFKRNIIIAILAVIACLFFIIGLLYASCLTVTKNPGNFPPFVNTSVLAIGGYLAVNAGVVLGFTFKSSDTKYSIKSNWNPFTTLRDPGPENIQILACYFYLLGLLIAIITYAYAGFPTNNPEKCVPLIESLSNTFIGVIAGALGVALRGKS